MVNQVGYGKSTRKKISELTGKLFELDIIKNFHIIPTPPDEPAIFLNSCTLYIKRLKLTTSGTGSSFISREEALLKCLSEAVERYSLFVTNQDVKEMNYHRDRIPQEILKLIDDKKITGWVKGYSLDEEVLLPAQLIYLDYNLNNCEPLITQPLSTGAASGTDSDSTLLRGIYELIERDSFLTIYLNQISAPLIDVSDGLETEIKRIISYIESYNLEVRVLNITNDLEIPTFLCIILDRTGLGPVCSLGLKTSLDINKAIFGAIEEAMHIRLWVRGRMVDNSFKRFESPNNIQTQEDRMMYWAPIEKLKNLGFFLNQGRPTSIVQDKLPNEELKVVIEKLKLKNHSVFYVDITQPIFRDIRHLTYKVVIPSLQFFYLDERYKKVNGTRLREVADYFNLKGVKENVIPHPFL